MNTKKTFSLALSEEIIAILKLSSTFSELVQCLEKQVNSRWGKDCWYFERFFVDRGDLAEEDFIFSAVAIKVEDDD